MIMIMKLKNGAELWLAGIPTERGCDRFPLAHLQVVCFPESPRFRGGVELYYGTRTCVWPMQTAVGRDGDWPEHFVPGSDSAAALYGGSPARGRHLGE